MVYVPRIKEQKESLLINEFWISNSKFQIPNSRFQIPDSRFQIPDFTPEIWNLKSGI
jgi:hypothetical protein